MPGANESAAIIMLVPVDRVSDSLERSCLMSAAVPASAARPEMAPENISIIQ